MESRLTLDLAASLDRRRVLAGLGVGFGGAVLAACDARAQVESAACIATPREIKGPFPADGSNGRPRPINVLDLEGVVRRDIRPSFAGLQGAADGVPLELELVLQGTDCAALRGGAIYLWQNDAEGIYSLYNRTDVNYLRGLQAADSNGRVRFTSIVPGCYGGRFPHCHFEVFRSIQAASAGEAPLLVSQLAFPAAECRAIYREDSRYGDSLRNLDRQPIERDFIFSDSDEAGIARQTVVLSGAPQTGYRGAATITVRA